jgi:hypothetical protein
MTMDNVTFIEVEEPTTGDVVEHAIIEHADGSFTSMLKSTYEAMQAEQSTPNLAGDEA